MTQKQRIKKNKPYTLFRVLLILLLILILFTAGNLVLSDKGLMVTNYRISAEQVTTPIRIVQLTDLHSSVFGKNNSRLISKVEEQSPDIILLTGDLINSKKGADPSVAISLIQNLRRIAPVYVSYGNQENNSDKGLSRDSISADLDDTAAHTEDRESRQTFDEIFSEAGAVVLKDSWVDIEVNGVAVRLGGIYGYCLPDKYAQETHRENETAYMKEFQDTDRYKILMCHIPVGWMYSLSGYDWDVDLVFGGHLHGGQIRIPFIGGVYAPDLGWFPGSVCGIYETEEEKWKDVFEYLKRYGSKTMDNSYYEEERSYSRTTVIVSRGLGNTEFVPRFNNIPEIIVTDLTRY